MKVGFNRVFGYYLEVTKANLSQVPADYIRKQTLVNAERYITEELKSYENEVLGAKERLIALEQELFTSIRQSLQNHIEDIQKLSQQIAQIDTLASLAQVALKTATTVHWLIRPGRYASGVAGIRWWSNTWAEPGSSPTMPNSTREDPG